MIDIKIDINNLDYSKSIAALSREMGVASNTLRRRLKALGIYEKFLFVQEGRFANRALKKLNVERYSKSPHKCKECGGGLTYESRKNIFCSHKCSAEYNNRELQCNRPTVVVTQKMRDVAKDTMLRNWSDGKMKRRVTLYKRICEKCHAEFNVSPSGLNRRFCSRECAGNNVVSDVVLICATCGSNFNVRSCNSKKRKFCSGKCRNISNNQLLRGNRSKAEKLLESQLSKQFSEFEILYNDRTILGGLELDVYIPQLKLAIEWNGIFHLKNIRGNLEKVKMKDAQKIDMCSRLGIELVIIEDFTSSPKFADQKIQEIVTMLNKKLYTDTMYSSEKTPNLLRVGEEPTISANFSRVHDVIA